MRKYERPAPGSDAEIRDEKSEAAKKLETAKSGRFDEAAAAENLGVVELRVSKEIARQAAMTKEQIAEAFEQVYRRQEKFGEEMRNDEVAAPQMAKFLQYLETLRHERPE